MIGTALALLLRLPELGQFTREQAAALAGLACREPSNGSPSRPPPS
jgi:hypothetical protein